MANYLQWNSAITRHLLTDCQPGDAVYLSVDEEFVISVADKYLKDKLESSPLNDLLMAVRMRCVDDNFKVQLAKCSGMTKHGNYQGLAFLSVMVIAAFKMGNTPGQGQQAYYNHLRRLLGFEPSCDTQMTRPPGMAINQTSGIAPEEPIWEGWNDWLRMKDFVPTAVPGSGATRYTRYAISQTLLRAADIVCLRRFFAKNHLSQRLGISWDKEDVLDSIQVEAQRSPNSLNSHITRILEENDKERVPELNDAMFRVYETMVWDLEVLRAYSKGQLSSTRQAGSGLLRGELVCFHEPLDNSFEFAMRVKLTADTDPSGITVLIENEQLQFYPFIGLHWALLPIPAGGSPGLSGIYPVSGNSTWKNLYLPQRQFWLLKQRAESLDTFTPDGALIAGEEILLICSNELVPYIEDWRHLGQMDWDRRIHLQGGWSAFWKFVVLSEEVVSPVGAPEDVKEFASACQRSKTPAILLSGGLKDPAGTGWLEQAMPVFRLVGTETQMRVVVSRASEDYPLCEMTDISPGVKYEIDKELPAGVYTIQVKQGRKSFYRRPFRIVKWQLVTLGNMDETIAKQYEVLPEVV